MKYFLDTNILSYLIKGNTHFQDKIANLMKAGNTVLLPAITYYETKRGLIASSAKSKMQTFMWFVGLFGIVDITSNTLDIASNIYAKLKQKGTLIEDDDIFIGASALENSAILVTNNAHHMKRIENLKIEIWEI